MEIDITRLFEDESFVSPGSIGGKIKKYREMRGWSQKELGIKCGFSPSSADVRIAQYEKNKKIPREKALKKIASALGIDEYALFDADLLVFNRMYHALFDIEDFYGLHPVKKPDGYYLEFGGMTATGQNFSKYDFEQFLEKWSEMRQRYMPSSTESFENKKAKAKEYALWRAEFPHNTAREVSDKMRDIMRKNRLQAEMDALNAKINKDELISKLDRATEAVMPKARSLYKPVSKESDFIYLIKDIEEKGLKIGGHYLEELKEPDSDSKCLLSVSTEDIFESQDNILLFAVLVCAIDTIRQYGIDISRRVVSRHDVLYIVYRYPVDKTPYFANLREHYNEMDFLIRGKNRWKGSVIQEIEAEFRKNITGTKDVMFSEQIEYNPEEWEEKKSIFDFLGIKP